MPLNPKKPSFSPPDCPAWLEDELLLIETSGEMPEVALQEAFLHLGELNARERFCLEQAALTGYLRILERDLDPKNLGQGHFRGLSRACQNWHRLKGYQNKRGQELPSGLREELADLLREYLRRERLALQAGRLYASATSEQCRELAEELGLPAEELQGILPWLAKLPAPDFLGLAALGKLERAKGWAKRKRPAGDRLVLEVLDQAGLVLAGATLPWQGPAGVNRENRQRAELVWDLMQLGLE